MRQKDFTIIQASEKEIPLALQFRQILLKEMGIPRELLINSMSEVLLAFYHQEFNVGRMRHYIAYSQENQPVAIAGAVIKNDFPYCLLNPGYYGWIMDVYTLPDYRGKKLATKLLELTNQWLVEKGVHEAKLIAVENDARRLYENLGYRATFDMSLNLTEYENYNEIIEQRVSGVTKVAKKCLETS
ncbi:GNAT family N-acetyltransferase [Pelosinus fermentans]|uniref:GNAT family N-acetyltransferase n=1 Tax=Pelosinus fermentans TaxID=365349 RepID=UPI00130DFDB9|nr:GNAT family N-acetyltransferase [Pelosinus fermentans]